MTDKRMRILILAHYFPPEMGGAAARLSGLARWLARFGHEVTVLTGFPNYPSGVIPESYRGKRTFTETVDGVEVVRTWVYASSHRSSLRRLANYLSYAVSATLTGLQSRQKYDVILASSPPLFIGLTASFLSRIWGVPWVFDLRDLWPDVAIEAGAFSPDSTITRLWRWLAQYFYDHAAHLTPVTNAKRKKLIEAGVPQKKITVVPNGVDLDMIPRQISSKRIELGLNNKFVILYAGLIGIAQGVDIILPAAQALRDREDIHFLIVGDGVKKQELESDIRDLELANITLLGHQPKEAMPEFLNTADVCLVPLASSRIQDAVPSKLLEAWAYGKPVILAADGEAAVLTHQSEGGIVVSPKMPEQFTDAILSFANDPQLCGAMGANGRAFVEEQFDRHHLAQKMEAVLHSVSSTHDKCHRV